MYHTKHYAYCGMSGLRHDHDDEQDARDYIARRLRSARRAGYPVVTLERGKEWEIQEPEECVLVPDACGTLRLWRETFECRECGHQHDTQSAAIDCCADYGESWEPCDDDDDDAIDYGRHNDI